MRESLERIGRFECKFILIDGVSVSFVVVRHVESHLALDRLYVVPEHARLKRIFGSRETIMAATDSQLFDALATLHPFHDRFRFFDGGLPT